MQTIVAMILIGDNTTLPQEWCTLGLLDKVIQKEVPTCINCGFTTFSAILCFKHS